MFGGLFGKPKAEGEPARPLPPDAQAQLEAASADLAHPQPQTRARAALAIDAMAAHFGRPDLRQQAVPALVEALASPDMQTGLSALEALRRSPFTLEDDAVRQVALGYLIEISGLEDEYARAAALEVLGTLGAQHRDAAEQAVPHLIAALRPGPAQAQIAAAQQRLMQQGEGYTPDLVHELSHRLRAEGELRASAALALGRIGERFGDVAAEAVPALALAAADPHSYWLGVTAAEALARLDAPEARALLAKLNTQNDRSHQA